MRVKTFLILLIFSQVKSINVKKYYLIKFMFFIKLEILNNVNRNLIKFNKKLNYFVLNIPIQ